MELDQDGITVQQFLIDCQKNRRPRLIGQKRWGILTIDNAEGWSLQQCGRKCYTKILPKINNEPKTLVCDGQSNVYRLPNIYLELLFDHQIEGDKQC